MVVYDSCDDASSWVTTGQTVISLDTENYVSPPASLKAETPEGQWWCYLAKWHSPIDLSESSIVSFYIKTSRVDKPISLMIATGTPTNPIEHHYFFSPATPNTWQKITIDLRNPSVEGLIPNLSSVVAFRIDWQLQNVGGVLRLDQIEFSPVEAAPTINWLPIVLVVGVAAIAIGALFLIRKT